MKVPFFISFLSVSSLLFSDVDANGIKQHAVFLIQQSQIGEGLERYKEFVSASGHHDFETLQQMGLILLQKGIRSEDPQVFLMSLFGSGISGSARSLEILEKGLAHPDPQIQLFSLHFISQFEDDRASQLLNRAMSSDFLSTRMEAAFYMAQRKEPHAVGQIEGLMFRLPAQFKPYFPSFFALLGTPEATGALRRLIEDEDVQTRVESILSVSRLGRDDFIPQLRKRLSVSQIAELEATIFSLGHLKDGASYMRLVKLTQSPTESIRLAAALALFNMGERGYVPLIEEMALKKNLFAIASLGQIPEAKETAAKLLHSNDLQVRLNAGIALLYQHDRRALPVLKEVLLKDAKDLAFHPYPSAGRTLSALKAVPSAELRSKDPTVDLGYSLVLREHFLKEALHLPEEDFLSLASLLFAHQQNDLVPTLISLLENLQTPGAIALLKKGAEKISSPLIRDYCSLALYRLKESGPYEEYIHSWIMQQKGAELIRMRPLLPWRYRLEQAEYTLSPEETSRLLIDTFLAIASQHTEKNIAFLLDAIRLGNPENRYALMGLLMRATE